MLIATTLACLFALASIATFFSLADSWMKGRNAYRGLMRERALLQRGFVPQLHASHTTLRQPARRAFALAAQSRSRRVSPIPTTPAFLPTPLDGAA